MPTKEQTFFANLELELVTYTEFLPNNEAKFYKPKQSLFNGDTGHIETKPLGVLYESEHPNGLLWKPCPVCGYKYGTSWKYIQIPEYDEKIIIELLKTGKLHDKTS